MWITSVLFQSHRRGGNRGIDSPGKLGYVILKNLQDAGFPGALYPINPKSERILGLDCYRGVKDVPARVDLAVVIIPARMVPQAVRECGEKGVKGAVVISGASVRRDPRAKPSRKRLPRSPANTGSA